MNALAIFRELSGQIVVLFPELPASRKPRECLAFTEAVGFHALDYDKTMFQSRPAKTRDYRDVLALLKKSGYPVNVIQQASIVMADKRKKAAETYDDTRPVRPTDRLA